MKFKFQMLSLRLIKRAGQEAIYYEIFQEFGYTAEEMFEWIPKPAHQPWWLMQNMSSYPDPISEYLINERKELGRKIADRLRKLGMTPVLPGYYRTVPHGFAQKMMVPMSLIR